MGRFFSMDNPFFSFMGRIADLFILNICFLICCIPIVTIGPSVTAMYYVAMKMVRNEESYIIKDFFHSFKQNIKQAILINLIMLGAGILLALDLYIVKNMTNPSNVLYVVFLVILILYVNIYIYVYPLEAKFFNTIKNTFVNAILMAISHLPYTVIMFVITLVPLFILLIPDAKIQLLLIFIYICVGPALCAYGKANFLVKIFDRYVPKEPEEGEDSEGSLLTDPAEIQPEALPGVSETISAGPETISAGPETISAAPETISAAPETISAAPETISAAPAEAPADSAPEQTGSGTKA